MPNRKPILIVVTGPPASGKTTLASWLARELCMPCIHKDGLKETLFDFLGYADRALSQRYGAACSELIWHLVEQHLQVGASLIIESNFHPTFAEPRLVNFVERYGCDLVCVHCWATQDVLTQRFRQRIVDGSRHPGHVETEDGSFVERSYALKIPSQQIKVNTTDFATVSYPSILAQIQSLTVD